jgi:hypothetical protein
METSNYLIEMDEATHTYYVDGEIRPSVTQILNICGMINDRWFTDFGRWRGSETHKATHYFDENDIDRRTIDPAVKPRLDSWIKFRKETGYTPTLIEVPLYDEDYQFCGRPDRRGYFMGGDPAESNDVVDLKNYNPPWWVRYQLAGYGWLLDKRRLFRRWAVELKDDGYNMIEYKREDYLSDVAEFLAFVKTAQVKLRYIR